MSYANPVPRSKPRRFVYAVRTTDQPKPTEALLSGITKGDAYTRERMERAAGRYVNVWRSVARSGVWVLDVDGSSAERRAAAAVVAVQALADNKCPVCGRGVHRNLSLAGWVQCDQFGAEGFRKDPNAPACDWQGFTQ